MKQTHTFLTNRLAALMVALMCLLPARPAAQDSTSVSLLVLHTNDTHSCIMPISKHNADTLQADKGGFLRRTAFVQRMRAERDSALLLFDCGDFSQGSPYYNLFRGEVEVKLMNHMRYDAATIGNHEFDFGPENMARLFRLAQFPIVCSNYGFSGTALEGLVKPYVVLVRRGVKVGVFGLGPKLEGLVAKANIGGVTYEDPIPAATRVVKHLREVEQCDLVICLSHLGWGLQGKSDEDLIRATTGIDIVLGGHSHTYLKEPMFLENAEGGYVVYNQMGKNGRYVGTLEVKLAPVKE